VEFAYRGKIYPFKSVYHKSFNEVNRRTDLWPKNIQNFDFEQIRGRDIIPLGVYKAIRKVINQLSKAQQTQIYEEAKGLPDKERKAFRNNIDKYSLYQGVQGRLDPNVRASKKVASQST